MKPFLPRKTFVVIREANTPSLSLSHGRLFRLLKGLMLSVYPFADAVICQTAEIALELNRDFHVQKSKIFIIENPVDVASISRITKDSQNPFLNQAKFQIVAAGRLTYQKGFDILLSALSKIVKEFPSVYLSVLGEGEERASLGKMIEDLELGSKVTLLGFVSPIEIYLWHADLFVLPSRWEGMPNVVLEALACGTPVVAMEQAGGIREIIQDGINGRVVVSLESEDLASTMGQALREIEVLKKGASLDPRFLAENVVRHYEKVFATFSGRT